MQTQSKFRLLVVRLGAMGDILHALPAVTALRRAHPDWEIGWLVEPRWQALLTAATPPTADPQHETPAAASARPLARPITRPITQPIIDRLHLAPIKQWKRRPLTPATVRELARLRRELRACAYSAVIDFQGSIRSAVLGRMAGAPRFLGEFDPRERPARWLFSERIVTRGAHVIQQDCELASAIAGDALACLAPLLPVDPAAEAWAESWAETKLAKNPAPLVLLNPGAGWGAKRWPAARYAAVAQGLVQRGLRVLVNAGPGEEPLAAEIHAATAGAATPVSPSLAQLIALTRRIALCIAGDTGPLHLACALARPVVGIYGPTDPARNGPFGASFIVLRSPSSRRDHTRRAQPESGLLTIQPGEVLRAADTLLAEANSSS